MEELGGFHVEGRDAVRGEAIQGRVTGVEGAAHRGEDHRPGGPPPGGETTQGIDLAGQALGSPEDGAGLAGDLRQEWVRKVS